VKVEHFSALSCKKPDDCKKRNNKMSGW